MSDRVGICLLSVCISISYSEENENRGRESILLQFHQIKCVEGFVPADVHEDLDPAIKLQDGLRSL